MESPHNLGYDTPGTFSLLSEPKGYECGRCVWRGACYDALVPYSMPYQILRNPTGDPRDNLWGQFLVVSEITSVLHQQSWAEPDKGVFVCLSLCLSLLTGSVGGRYVLAIPLETPGTLWLVWVLEIRSTGGENLFCSSIQSTFRSRRSKLLDRLYFGGLQNH